MHTMKSLLTNCDAAAEREIAAMYAAPFDAEALYLRSVAKYCGETLPPCKRPVRFAGQAVGMLSAAACLLLVIGLIGGVWMHTREPKPVPAPPLGAVDETQPATDEPTMPLTEAAQSVPTDAVPAVVLPTVPAAVTATEPDSTEASAVREENPQPVSSAEVPATGQDPTEQPTEPLTEPQTESATEPPTAPPTEPTESTVPMYADTADVVPEDKISAELRWEMADTEEGAAIPTVIWYRAYSDAYISAMVGKRLGDQLDSIEDAQSRAALEHQARLDVTGELYSNAAAALLEQLGIGETPQFVSAYSPMIVCNLTNSQIRQAAECGEVLRICHYTEP